MPVSKITSAKTALSFKKPRLFSSAYTRNLTEDSGVLFQSTREDLSDTNIDSTSSFRYDSPGMGVRSTQQIPLDWSAFENHTFFNSAEVNVNVAFDRIINEFPFDGTRKEFEAFFDSLTGFEKYVFDSFPKNVGYLFFTGSAYIKVNDFAGSEYPTISKEKSGKSVLDPGPTSPFCFEFHLLVPDAANSNAVICQKLNNDHGFTLALSASASSAVCDLVLMVSSGSSNLSSSIEIGKGQFNHLVASVDRRPTFNRIEFYNNAELVGSSSLTQEFGQFDFIASPMYIGSGSAHTVGDVIFEPTTTLSGAVDDFRMFHGTRTTSEQSLYGKKGIFASDDLALYFKFNEPTGSLGGLSNIVLDSSGNSLHSKILSFSQDTRSTGSYAVPVTSERLSRNPILFPGYSGVVALNVDLLVSASSYDQENPNLITRLVPQHYLWEGQTEEGFEEPEGTIGDSYAGDGLPGTGELGSPQILGSLLYVWAKFFDEQKIMIDHFSALRHVDYDDDGTVSDQFLPELFQYYGFDAPNFFSNATIEQYVDADNLGIDVGVSALSLQEVQNQLWRRILVNLRDIVASKGTIHSVKSLIRSIGVNPDTTIRIREYGGKTKRNLADARLNRTEVSSMLDFSGSLSDVIPALDTQGYPTNLPFVRTQYLSSSRVEAGFPLPAGTMTPSDLYPIHGISDDPDDGTLTSGSFTIEGLYRFPVGVKNQNFVTQSLFRLCTTGSEVYPNIVVNVVAVSGSSSDDGQVILYARPSAVSDIARSDQLILPISGVNVVDGNVWHVTAGRISSERLTSPVSSSWFLRVGRETNGMITKFLTASSFHQDSPQNASLDVLSNITTQNTSGSFILIGSQSLGIPASNFFLNRSDDDVALQTNFDGKVSQVRFWSKNLTVPETKEHIRNFKSAGVESPRVNYNFDNTESGSWERLRLNIATDQPVTESDSLGSIILTDFSQNQFFGSGTGFENDTQVIKPETFYYSHLSPRFDEASTDNKVRIRSMLDQDNVDEFDASAAPLYEITPSEVPNDDTRFSIDFSLIDSLDEDIITIFATLDDLDNILGEPNLLYSPDYPALENLREIYFNRLTDRINLKSLYEFFKWLDTSMGMFIEQLLPRKTNYLGTNFVIESHMLERPKVRYKNEEIYLDEDLRSTQSTSQTYLGAGDVTSS
jgi:hypothetical protein